MDNKEIDFSHVLKQSFHATLNDDKVEITKGKENMKLEVGGDKNRQDVSVAACHIVESLPRNMLTCPFCSEEYLFEFTMKEHLKKHHSDEIQKLDSWPVQQHFCPYCRAMFYYSNLIPKHIHFAHGKEMLDNWFATDNNLQKFQIDKENKNEPSVRLLDCSPGLSELFNDLDTCDSIKKFKRDGGSFPSTPVSQPRSILKKTPYSGKIVILSPESAALRRTINSLKRSASARRALRFDLPPLQASPPETSKDLVSPPKFNLQTPPKKKFWNFFGSRKSPPPINTKVKKKIRAKACKMSNRTANQIITSTPRHCFDDSDDGCDELDKDETIGSNWKSALKTSNFRPLFLAAERFQCNLCEAKFDTNAELLFHQKQTHKRISFLPPYRCGQCASKFYRNSYLVRHCHFQHTPTKH
jgi:hypothetical protein